MRKLFFVFAAAIGLAAAAGGKYDLQELANPGACNNIGLDPRICDFAGAMSMYVRSMDMYDSYEDRLDRAKRGSREAKDLEGAANRAMTESAKHASRACKIWEQMSSKDQGFIMYSVVYRDASGKVDSIADSSEDMVELCQTASGILRAR